MSVPPYELPAGFDVPVTLWARPSQQPRDRDKGDADADSIYLAVGKALTCWELAEIHLGELFALLVESDSPAARRAYGTAPGAKARLAMLQVTAESYFEDDRTRQADALVAHKLLENYDKAAERRNDIAHGIVTEITAGRLGRFGHFLVPPDYNERRTKPPGRIDRLYRKSHGISPGFKMSRNRAYLARVKFAYASYDIAGFADKFGELALAVEFFIQNLSTFRQFGAS